MKANGTEAEKIADKKDSASDSDSSIVVNQAQCHNLLSLYHLNLTKLTALDLVTRTPCAPSHVC